MNSKPKAEIANPTTRKLVCNKNTSPRPLHVCLTERTAVKAVNPYTVTSAWGQRCHHSVPQVHDDKAGRPWRTLVFSDGNRFLRFTFICNTLSWPLTSAFPAPIHASQHPSFLATSPKLTCRLCAPGSSPAISGLITKHSSFSQTHFINLSLIYFPSFSSCFVVSSFEFRLLLANSFCSDLS